MEQKIRYCATKDGARIAYAIVGDGIPYVWIPSSLQSGSLIQGAPGIGAQENASAVPSLVQRWAHHFAVVRYDSRGCGLSSAASLDLSLEARLHDLEAVIRALGTTPVILRGMADAAAIAIAYAGRFPEQVRALVLFAAFASGSALAELRRGMSEALAALIKAEPSLGSQALVAAVLGESPIGGAVNATASAEQVTLLFEAMTALDVTPVLGTVVAPTLVIHGRNDTAIPIELGQSVAAQIPNSQFYAYDGPHFPPNQQTVDHVSAVISEFLGIHDAGASESLASTAFRTVLFTDVVENTALLRRIGDEAWRAVMREHEEIVRAALKEHGGTEISTSGDSFFASFGGSVRALQCAVDMQRAFVRRNDTAEHAVEVRIGLNAGEPIEEGKEVLGTAVTMAARIMSQAGGGEILVSDVVRQLVAGKGFLFADRGEFVAKGFEEPVRVYEVRWRDG